MPKFTFGPQVFKFTFGPGDIGYIWSPKDSTIAQAKAIVGLNPIKVEKVDTAPEDRIPDAEMQPGWRFG